MAIRTNLFAFLILSPKRFSTAADERDRLAFRSFQIADKGVLVFGEVGVRPGNLPMQQALFDFANKESKFIAHQCFHPFDLELFDVVDRVGVGDPRAARHRRQDRCCPR